MFALTGRDGGGDDVTTVHEIDRATNNVTWTWRWRPACEAHARVPAAARGEYCARASRINHVFASSEAGGTFLYLSARALRLLLSGS